MQHPAIKEIALEIFRAISVLPQHKVDEVRDFANFLKDRYSPTETIDYSETWTEEDIQDLTAFALQHAMQTVWLEDEHHG